MQVPKLLLITDSQRLERERFYEVVEAALKGGVDAVLVREKSMDSARLLAFSSRLREMTHQARARLLIHSQADVARAVSADGVHVAASDIREIPAMRNWLADASISLSASCHDAEELEQAAIAGADFALLSPVFPTQSHPGAQYLGVERFRQLVQASPVPLIALGGITADNRGELAGFSVAVIGAILDAKDPETAAKSLGFS